MSADTAPRLLPMGERAILLELPDLETALAWHAELRARPLLEQESVLAAARTVLVRLETPEAAAAARDALAHRHADASRVRTGRTRRIGVVYDGEDLEEVAEATGMSPQEVISAHTGTPWRAAFGGFAPGFLYLTGGDERLAVPRRSSPRTRVPAGAVALAGEFSAIYPQPSPGGWQLIGRTTATLWDADRDEPALLAPGDTVVFTAERARSTTRTRSRDRRTAAPAAPGEDATALEILDPGLRTLIEDEGRPGQGDLGVTAAGAADGPSARQANRLVGNRPHDAVLETLLGGLRVRARGDVVLALTGAIGEALVQTAAGTEDAPLGAPFGLRGGEELQLGTPAAGLRGYLAIRGGLDVPAQLGSRSSDTLSGLGPEPLAEGDVLPIGPADPHRSVGSPEVPATVIPPPEGETELRIRRGPRADWAEDGALLERIWTIGADTDRVGARLDPADGAPSLRREREDELPSEGMLPGAIQLPPSGLPVVFLADHPVTGGYPVIAVVDEEDLPRLAQLTPGSRVRLVDATEQG